MPTPKDSHPVYEDGYAFHGNFGKVDVYIMDAKLLKRGVPTPLDTSRMLLEGFGDKHGMTIGKASPYASLAGGDGIQLVTSATNNDGEFGVSVHSVNKGNRQVNVRIVWPKDDKKSLDDAYRISNSLRIR